MNASQEVPESPGDKAIPQGTASWDTKESCGWDNLTELCKESQERGFYDPASLNANGWDAKREALAKYLDACLCGGNLWFLPPDCDSPEDHKEVRQGDPKERLE